MAVHASTHLRLDPHAAPVQTCGECQSFAPLQSMVGGGAVDVLTVAIPNDHVVPTDSNFLVAQRAFTAFRSRAPPISI